MLEALAKLSLELRDFELCKKHAIMLLRVNKDHEQGMFLLAEATFLLGDRNEATKLYAELLERFPNYAVLSRFIQLMRMSGRLGDVIEVVFYVACTLCKALKNLGWLGGCVNFARAADTVVSLHGLRLIQLLKKVSSLFKGYGQNNPD